MKNILILCLFLGLATALSAQYEDEVPDSTILSDSDKSDGRMREKKKLKLDNFFVGSGVSFQFWGDQLRFDILPYFGYKIGGFAAPALGLSYTYYYDSRNQSSMNIYGPRAMLRLYPFYKFAPMAGVYLHGEYEHLIVDIKQNNRSFRDYQPRGNLGLGYNSCTDKGFGMTYELLFDLYGYKNGSIFSPLIYRIGFYYQF